MFRSKFVVAVVAIVGFAVVAVLALAVGVAVTEDTNAVDRTPLPMQAGQHMMPGMSGARAGQHMAMPAMPMSPDGCPLAGQGRPAMPGMPHDAQGMVAPGGAMPMPGMMHRADMPMMQGAWR
jgi:hypothetical protein